MGGARYMVFGVVWGRGRRGNRSTWARAKTRKGQEQAGAGAGALELEVSLVRARGMDGWLDG